MTSKNKNDYIEPEKDQEAASSAETQESSNDISNASESPSASSKKKSGTKASPDTIRQQEKNAKRGIKLGAVAIVVSLLCGGFTLQVTLQNAEYQSQIEQLQKQLEQTAVSFKQDLNATQQETLAKAAEISHKTETVLSQQQKSIEGLQLALADVKGRRPNDWLLAEADYLVKLAGRKLFLEHDTVSATKLMESADQRIAALSDPSLVPLRRTMAHDITELKSIPIIDREGLVLRLTSLQQQVDSLPLANAILPDAPERRVQHVSEDIYDWKDNLMTSLKDFSESFITFRTRDGNVTPLLSPEQHFYLKENMKAKLETAIKAVYVEQQDIYQTALTTAEKWSSSFFDQHTNAVIEFNKALKMLSKQNVQVEYPAKLDTEQLLSDVIHDRLRHEVTTLVTEEK
ncbi:uroporphyrin-III methyltransferase [Vibrio neptunius]|uniref:uroporphyrinogen-III C-methyltransferase n=1 Tax=Vibrio neptunius TaxID=170651 RepID=UPI0005FA87EB|nr:uroporphyrinogen-III C-methyltransferase [Vibrio neptunius]KJY90066.1 uroporphyrin-III methyltransferase [Vibrio neptunius]